MKYIRFTFFILLLVLIFTHLYFMTLYWLVLLVSIEALNMQAAYRKHVIRPYANTFFIAYFISIIIERIHLIRFSQNTFYIINILEHLAFAILVSLQLYIWGRIKANIHNKYILALVVLLIFNVLGFANELYQNMIRSPETLFSFSADTNKDMLMNAGGSLLFFVMVSVRYAHSKRTQVGEA